MEFLCSPNTSGTLLKTWAKLLGRWVVTHRTTGELIGFNMVQPVENSKSQAASPPAGDTPGGSLALPTWAGHSGQSVRRVRAGRAHFGRALPSRVRDL